MGGARGQIPQRTEGQIPGPAETREDNNACQRPMNTEKCGVTIHSVCLGPCCQALQMVGNQTEQVTNISEHNLRVHRSPNGFLWAPRSVWGLE